MTRNDSYLQTALNGVINSIKEMSEEKMIEEYILDALKDAFPHSSFRRFMVDYIGNYLKENNK